MKQNELHEGRIYLAKVSHRVVKVRLDRIEEKYDSFVGRDTKRFHVTNLKTNRKIVFRSAAKFRSEWTAQLQALEASAKTSQVESDAAAGMLADEQLEDIAYLEGESA